MKIKNDQAGLTLVELLVTIAVGSVVMLADCTMLLFGLRINNQSTKNTMGQNTVQVLMEALEDVAAEAQNLGIVSEPDSWMIYDTNGTTDNPADDKVVYTYLSANQTIYSGRAVEPTTNLLIGTPFLKGIHASEVEYDAAKKLLTIDVQTAAEDNYSTSIYCRMGTSEVSNGSGLVDLVIEYLTQENKAAPAGIALPEKETKRFEFLKTLASQIDSRGKINGTGEYYAVWYKNTKGLTGEGWDGDTPWCACHLSWALANTTGVSNPPNEANVEKLKNEFKGVNWREPKEHFSSGDLIFFNFDEDAESDHVGAVIGKTDDGKYIYTIEGNTAGKVAVRKYEVGDKRIMGYGVLS